jgi:Rod binding domain-containing protein
MNTSTIDSNGPLRAGTVIPDAVSGAGLESGRTEMGNRARKLKRACRDFQALLIGYMIKTMRKSIPKSGLLDDGLGGEIYAEMFDMKVAEALSGSSGFGLDDMLFRQLAPRAFGEDWEKKAGDLKTLNSNVIKYSNNTDGNPYEAFIRASGRKYNIAPTVIRAIIDAESNWDYLAYSDKGAKGLMQLMDSVSDAMGVPDPFNPRQNIEGGTRYLRSLLDRYNGDLKLALAAYNAGPESVDKCNGIPAYPETEEYVGKIMRALGYDLIDPKTRMLKKMNRISDFNRRDN